MKRWHIFGNAIWATIPILGIICTLAAAASTPSKVPSLNPYKVLGVSKDATDAEIKKRYRKLCLKYHPDKHANETPFQREKCEQTFKQIQTAHAQIGDENSRREYDSKDTMTRMYGNGVNDFSGSSNGRSQVFDEIFQESFRRMNQRRFYVNGVDVSHLFRKGPVSYGTSSSDMPGSKYIEKVTIPLQDLYSGVARKQFVLHDNWIKRYIAAFRGGIGSHLAVRMLFRYD